MAEKDATSLAFTTNDLLEKYHGSRKANLKLLDDKHELLLELQGARQSEHRLTGTCEQLQSKVEDLGKQLAEMKQIRHSQSNILSKENGEVDQVPSDAGESAACKCKCAEFLEEVIEINHEWNDAHKKSVARSQEAERRTKGVERELRVEVEENAKLVELVDRLEKDLESQKKYGIRRMTSVEEVCTKDDIEALKIQMMTFKDDFDTEREEKHKSLEESRQFKSQLDEANRVIQTLSDKIAVYKEHILKLSGSQDHLRKQITALIDSENEMPNSIQRQHSQRYSYPFSSEDFNLHQTDFNLHQTDSTIRRSEGNMFVGGDVVRDS